MQSANEKIKDLLLSNREALLQADASTQKIPNGICFDGIVDETIFYAQPKKVAFLLKETNGNDAGGRTPESYTDWDYRGWLQHQQANDEPGDECNSRTFYKTFYNVCMWLDVFYDTLAGKHISYEEYMASGRFNSDTLRKTLSKTAIVNLKKTWGSAATKWKALNSYLQREAVLEVLRKEVAYIGPDIVICGSREVFDFAKNIFGDELKSLSASDSPKTDYFQTDGMLFLNFYHPAYYYKKREDLYNNSAETFCALHTLF